MAIDKDGHGNSIAETAIIGRIPGYNVNIDPEKKFANELIKGLTFIDMSPVSYKLFGNVTEGWGDFSADAVFSKLKDIINKPGLFERDTEGLMNVFQGILERMRENFTLDPQFSKVQRIRLIAANESTFQETFSNDFNEENGALSAIKGLGSFAGSSKIGQVIQKGADALKWAGKGLRGASYSDMIALAGKAASTLNESSSFTKGAAAEILAGAFFGMNLAAPKQWSGSSYQSSLTVMIKLIAPVGTKACVKRNILEPILYLLAAASPLTYGGTMYGFPLLWDIHAHGITHFRLGGIGALTIIKGSFETSFNYMLEPTIVDVRLSLVPLLTDFAVQTIDLKDDKNNIYSETNSKYFGVQNPSDINRGITNKASSVEAQRVYTIKL